MSPNLYDLMQFSRRSGDNSTMVESQGFSRAWRNSELVYTNSQIAGKSDMRVDLFIQYTVSPDRRNPKKSWETRFLRWRNGPMDGSTDRPTNGQTDASGNVDTPVGMWWGKKSNVTKWTKGIYRFSMIRWKNKTNSIYDFHYTQQNCSWMRW